MPPQVHHSPSKRLAVVSQGIASGKAPERILYFPDDDLFLLLDGDVDVDPDRYDGELTPLCLDCLLEQHRAAGRGLDIARRAGSSRFHAGVWMEEA